MSKWYVARAYEPIKEVEVEKETKCCLVIRGQREPKTCEGYHYYRQTREEAKAALVTQLKRELERSKRHVTYAEKRLKEAEAL